MSAKIARANVGVLLAYSHNTMPFCRMFRRFCAPLRWVLPRHSMTRIFPAMTHRCELALVRCGILVSEIAPRAGRAGTLQSHSKVAKTLDKGMR